MKILKSFRDLFIPLLFFLFAFDGLRAQAPFVPGQIMVQLEKNITIDRWIDSQNHALDFEFYQLEEKVSAPMNIYLLTYEMGMFSNDQILYQVRSAKQVVNAQFNHYVDQRTVPDDAQYTDQWQYNNTGQSGGTPGADIDIEAAWDITTGGLTAEGDTIVVCILDDGIDNDHEDIIGNLWVNNQEIPNNGIDDDGNGFIDDYRGWDASSNNDDVYDGGGHGTPVAGCVGAQGNNGIGVTGVNWDVKLMIVQRSSGVESEVLEAYSYPLTMRQMYTESNGATGAFVVATNASWGVDFGQPADAPIWCAMYDTLGVHGILNCGATTNGNQNVDVVGDLPTACPSDYMISVTNMNHFDNKVASAGYGLETIDLGAFGQGTWTVAANNGYAGFGGTSGATPHVAGTIALLYSAPCPDLISLAKLDPQGAADLVRQAVLEGVDPNASLDGITTTGGRLNVKNALDLLLLNCGDCLQPYAVEATTIGDILATIEWTQADSVDVVDLEYSIQGSGTWTSIGMATSPFTIDDLEACTFYDIRLLGYCDGNPTAYSQIISIETDGCCENPDTFSLADSDYSTAFFNWEPVLAAEAYNIRIREEGFPEWTQETTNDTEYGFQLLNECTTYEVQIQLQCADEDIDFSESIFFTTLGCGACTDFEYCEITGADNSWEWIAEVVINDLTNTSGAGEGAYENFSDLSVFLEQGETYDVSFTPGYIAQAYEEYFIAWLDVNHDGEFTNDEIIFDAGATTNTAVTGQIEIPADATLGITRFRVAMAFDGAPGECDLGSEFGETEDYCVNIVLSTGIDDLHALDSSWELVPNPAADFVQIQIETELMKEVTSIDIISHTGQMIKTISTANSNGNIKLDLVELATGMYFIGLNNATKRVSIKKLTKL